MGEAEQGVYVASKYEHNASSCTLNGAENGGERKAGYDLIVTMHGWCANITKASTLTKDAVRGLKHFGQEGDAECRSTGSAKMCHGSMATKPVRKQSVSSNATLLQSPHASIPCSHFLTFLM